MIIEKLRKGRDINDTQLYDRVLEITDDNLEMKGDYILKWDIIKA